MTDSLGDRIKAYESVETSRRLDPNQPVCARIDGRAFSKFTKGMDRPYDERLARIMQETARLLVEKTCAKIGYTQSDEISLIWAIDREESPNGELMFGGKTSKLNSVVSGMATSIFMHLLQNESPEFSVYAERLPHFDCRCFNIPDENEATNVLIWRELDASRNAVSMVAQYHFSHASLQGVGTKEMAERLFEEKGVDFDRFPDWFKFGSYFLRTPYPSMTPTGEEVLRHKIDRAPFVTLRPISNRADVVFRGASALFR